MARPLQYLLAFAAAFIILQYFSSQSRAQARTVDIDNEDATGHGQWVLGKPKSGWEPEHRKDLDKEPKFRVEYGRGPGGVVMGWPAKGGVYVLESCFGVELAFLGVDRFHNTLRPYIADPTAAAHEEETHCNKMRQLGATWWKSEYDYMNKVRGEPGSTDTTLAVGWTPRGGVWVLKMSPMKARIIGAAIIDNAYNMEERWRAIKQLGGLFYENPKNCPYLDLP